MGETNKIINNREDLFRSEKIGFSGGLAFADDLTFFDEEVQQMPEKLNEFSDTRTQGLRKT